MNRSEPIFTTLFTLEFLIKIIALGVAKGPNTYFKDAWNWLDFIVVVSSLLSSLPQVGNISALRTFRLIRPLKSLNQLPSMKLLVGTLLKSIRSLGEIMIFAFFFFLIFAVLGLSLW